MQINKETIEQLFRQHYLRMYQLARVLLKDDAASKDVVSEVFADGSTERFNWVLITRL